MTAEALYHLQEFDLQIMRNRKRLKEIATQLDDNQAIQEARGRVQAVEAQLKPMRTRARDLELEIQTNQEKAKSSEERLYSGNVKNPKEMQDLQQEVAALKKRNGELEEQLLEQMMQVEEAESDLATRTDELKAVLSAAEGETAHLIAEQKEIALATQELKAKREEAAQNIDSASLERYEQMRPKKGGRPVAALQEKSCSVCNFEQTGIIIQEVRRRQKLVLCVNCGRILADVR